MRTLPEVSVVVCSVDRAKWLAKSLLALQRQRTSFEYEVIVVLGPTTDESEKIILEFPNVNLYKFEERNLSEARNIGIKLSKGGVVAFLDDDAVPDFEWLANLCNPILLQEVSVTCGRTLVYGTTEVQANPVAMNSFLQTRPIPLNFEKISVGADEFPSFLGANFAVSKNALEEINGFDHEFRWFLDETDLAIRLHGAGYSFRYTEKAVVNHAQAESQIRSSARIYSNYSFNFNSLGYFIGKHAFPNYGLTNSLNCLSNHVSQSIEGIRSAKLAGLYSELAAENYQEQVQGSVVKGFLKGISPKLQPLGLSSLAAPEHHINANRVKNENILKIAYVLNGSFDPKYMGGLSKWIFRVVPELAKLGHEIFIFVNDAEATHSSTSFQDGYWLIQVGRNYFELDHSLSELPHEVQHFLNSLKRTFGFFDSVRAFDLIVSPLFEALGTIFLEDKRLITSLMTSTREYLETNPQLLSYHRLLQGRILPLIHAEDKVLENSRYFHANSNSIVEQLQLPRKSEQVIEIITPGLSNIEAPIRVFDVNQEINFLFVGRFEPRKGVDILLESWLEAGLFKDGHSLTLCGNGGIEYLNSILDDIGLSKLEMHHHYGVTFKFNLSDEELLQEYEHGDLLVVPSRFESFGLIMAEAFRSAMPVIGSNKGGLGEFLESGGGWVFDLDIGSSSLTQVLKGVVQDRESIVRESEICRIRFEKEIEMSIHVDATLTYYSSIMRNLSGPDHA
jgi:glycosyltransferase involved in cell wall biosynthesis/GT2 family glycosyltransferase